MLCGSDGLPIRASNVVSLGKSTQNKFTCGFGTALHRKSLRVSAQFDVRYGGYVFSCTKNLMDFTGNGVSTLYNDRNVFVIPNSVVEDGNGGYAENRMPSTNCRGATRNGATAAATSRRMRCLPAGLT